MKCENLSLIGVHGCLIQYVSVGTWNFRDRIRKGPDGSTRVALVSYRENAYGEGRVGLAVERGSPYSPATTRQELVFSKS